MLKWDSRSSSYIAELVFFLLAALRLIMAWVRYSLALAKWQKMKSETSGAETEGIGTIKKDKTRGICVEKA